MGKPREPDACVDKNFRVMGVQGLRVVDMSVVPLMPRWVLLLDVFFRLWQGSADGIESAHTQAVADVIGETAAEKIVAEYKKHERKESLATDGLLSFLMILGC